MATLTHDPQTSTSERQRPDRQNNGNARQNGTAVDRLAKGLGWFSVGLGITELLAPRAIARLVGSRNHTSLIRAYGLRELAAGVGILTTSRPGPWLWSRVAGDVVDLASLGATASSTRNGAGTALGIASVAGVTVLDVISARRACESDESTMAARAEASLMVNRSPEDCYHFWRRLENLARFMTHLQSVRDNGERRSHWTAQVGGRSIEWDAEIETDVPNHRIAWRTLPGSELHNSGSVEFERAPGGRGTIVRFQMDYGNTLHALGAAAATLVGKNPEQIIRKELRRFKQMMETGEVITTEGQPAGQRSGATWLDQIAR
jgi:uncharacterized membrane protein